MDDPRLADTRRTGRPLRWLQDNWADVDAWISRHRPGTGAAAGRSAREVVPPSADP